MSQVTILPVRTTKDIKFGTEVIRLIEAIFPEVYLVGGAVRDALLQRDNRDLDFSVPYQPEDISKLLRKNKLPVYEAGIKFNTVGTSIGEFSIQITSYRSESYAIGSRKPEVEKVRDIFSDIDRRDFTINAFALSKSEFLDLHNGIDDLKNKQIRCVLDPEQKFIEDPVRILRAYRLVAQYGFNIEEYTHASIIKIKPQIRILSSERLGEELKKLVLGIYWSDALFEMIEDGVFNVILEQLGISVTVIADNAFSILDNYSASALESMSELNRWISVLEIINDAETNSGATTVDRAATAEHFFNKAALPRSLRIDIKNYYSESIINTSHVSETKYLNFSSEKIAKQYEFVKEQKLKGKSAYYDTKEYGVAFNAFKASIEMLDKLYNSALKDIRDKDLRQEKLKKLSRNYIDHMSFKIASYIMANRLYAKYPSTKALERKLGREFPSDRLNKKDQQQAIYEALVRIYRSNPFEISIEPFDVFLDSIKNRLSNERYYYYFRSYLYHKLKITDSLKEKSLLNKKLARVISRQSDNGAKGLDYYDAYIDYLYYSALSTDSLELFRKSYDLLSQELPDYMAAASAEGKGWYAIKRSNLNAASCNIHAFNLSKSIEEKYAYVSDAIDYYEDAGLAYQRNANRYRIHKDWLEFVKWLQNKNLNTLSFGTIRRKINNLTSFGYIDSDEAYFSSKMQDTAHIRDLIGDINNFLTICENWPKARSFISDKSLEAIYTLFKNGVINEANSLIALRNYIRLQSKLATEDIDNQVTDISNAAKEAVEIDQLLVNLEDKNTEFKASWKYDVDKSTKKQPTSNNEIKINIAHTITAFMNTDGGTILIGVTNDRVVCGIEDTDAKIYKNAHSVEGVVDKIKLDIDEIFEKDIGKEFQNFKDVSMKKYKGKTVVMIKVRKVVGEQLVPFGDSIYVRGEAGTRALKATEVTHYLKNRKK